MPELSWDCTMFQPFPYMQTPLFQLMAKAHKSPLNAQEKNMLIQMIKQDPKAVSQLELF